MVTEIHIFNRKIEEVQQRIVELFTEDERMWGKVPVYVHENEGVSRNPILLSNIYKLDADEARVPLIESFGERNVRFTADLPAHTPELDGRAFEGMGTLLYPCLITSYKSIKYFSLPNISN